MADETRKLQKDPPEGSRKIVEDELERQRQKSDQGSGGSGSAPRSGGNDNEAGGKGSR